MKDITVLINQAKEGVEGAFGELFDMYYNTIKYTIYNIVKNKDVTDDLVSVTFTKAFNKIASYTNPISFEMWLKTIAINTAIDYIRKMKNEKHNNYIDDADDPQNLSSPLQSSVHSAEDEMIIKEDYKRLMECMATLRYNYRNILKLRYIDELSYKDIASTLGVSEATVKSDLFKARQRLRKKFLQT